MIRIARIQGKNLIMLIAVSSFGESLRQDFILAEADLNPQHNSNWLILYDYCLRSLTLYVFAIYYVVIEIESFLPVFE